MLGGLTGGLAEGLTGIISGSHGMEVEGTVILMRKEVMEFNDLSVTSVIGDITQFLGTSVSLQLVSATVGDPNNHNKGKVGAASYLQEYFSVLHLLSAGESKFKVKFKWDASYGVPGAVIVKSLAPTHFLLKTVTIEDFPGHGRIHFVCNSWVYPAFNYSYDRIFFSNITYLPKDTPGPLKAYREEELKHLRGDDVTWQLLEWDRVYNYATYNDLGTPELPGFSRPVLGGNADFPYPRRGRTNRPASLIDPHSETRPLLTENFYPELKADIANTRNKQMVGLLLNQSLHLSAHQKWVKFLEAEISVLHNKKKAQDKEEAIAWCFAVALCIAGVGYALGRYRF